ncbi:MAG TPA: IS630 family transposase [Anaeromyxobacteraceae bacterium]|nr:IS630 family transposase [Anaeromyxobacteraceae bacterium]
MGKPITHWSASELRDEFAARRSGADVSASTVARVLREAQLQPHRSRYFLTSHDPLYDEKLRAIVGLYLSPPHGATILSIDEKPSIQALSRKYPDLPMRPGAPVAREFEYVRHGVMHLFAGFNVRTGKVLGHVYEQKTRAEFIDFLERCAWCYRQGPVHCVLDNASYHSTPEVKAWLAEHSRFVFHFTPTHASWLNQVECWFSILSRKVLRRGAHETRRDLTRALLDYIEYWNAQAHPFDWAYGEQLVHDSSIAA